VIRFFKLSFTNSRSPLPLSASPVGPITRTAGRFVQVVQEPITVVSTACGIEVVETESSMRYNSGLVYNASVGCHDPLSTLVKKSSAMVPSSRTVASQGPLMGPPEKVSTTCAVAAVPSLVGKLPTITQPARKTTSAVVKPTPPGQEPGRLAALIGAKVCTAPAGEISIIVVPVPCRLAELLKLLTKRSPWTRFPSSAVTTTF